YQTSQGIKTIPKDTVQRIQHQVPSAPPGATSRSYGIALENDREATSGANRRQVTMPFSTSSKDVSDEIVQRLKENVRSDPGDLTAKNELIEALNSYASLQLLKGDAQAASKSLLEALTYDKKNLKTLLNLSILLYQSAEYRAAEELLLRVIQSDSRNRYGHYLLGEVYYAQDK